jgi:hypothetical protein
MNTFACGLATITRGGWTPSRCDEEEVSGTGGALGCSAGGGVTAAAGTGGGTEALFWGKSGVVFALEGEPVTGGAAGFGEIDPDEGLETLGIGLVTAVDQAGGDALATGVISIEAGFIGIVVAAETFGRDGTILVDAGLSGRGGKLIRNVSRLGAFGSAGSAIILPFYSYFGKCSIAKFAIITYLLTCRLPGGGPSVVFQRSLGLNFSFFRVPELNNESRVQIE